MKLDLHMMRLVNEELTKENDTLKEDMEKMKKEMSEVKSYCEKRRLAFRKNMFQILEIAKERNIKFKKVPVK